MTEAVRNEIDFMLGSKDESEEFLKDILLAHGYKEEQFGWLGVDDDPELTEEINQKFFETGIITPFVWEGDED